MTDTAEKIEEMIFEIESASRLKVSKLVNNTNLVGQTTVEDVLEGHRMIKELSQKLDIPIAFVSGFREIADEVRKIENTEVLYLDGLIKLPWD